MATSKQIWYLAGPFTKYDVDVKALAEKAGLRIVDARFAKDTSDGATDVPSLGEEKPKPKRKRTTKPKEA